ncbi:MAG: dTMP kinase [Gammaproteobacteria bacterium]|nr:dTMP kinase [Gammaproteobacteria bacterium]
MTPGSFITLEGIEGAGKSTLAAALTVMLERRGVDIVRTREPGGTPLAERVRAVVLEPGAEALTPVAEMLLMFAARRIHLDNLVRPALARGACVICDRFTDATRAYQGAGRGVAMQLIDHLASLVHDGLQPSATVLLDLPVADGLARARARRGEPDRFEVEETAFFERVRACYLELAHAEPERFIVLDARRPPQELADEAANALLARLSG